jgi:hypothetical protein
MSDVEQAGCHPGCVPHASRGSGRSGLVPLAFVESLADQVMTVGTGSVGNGTYARG